MKAVEVLVLRNYRDSIPTIWLVGIRNDTFIRERKWLRSLIFLESALTLFGGET